MRFLEKVGALSAVIALASSTPIEKKEIKKNFSVHQTIPKPVLSGPALVAKTFYKFGKEPPANVKEAAANNDGSVVTTPTQYDSQYLTPVTIGGQQLNLDFDTGSSDFSSSGVVYTDTVTIGQTSFAGQAVELATQVSDQFSRDGDNDGLLGLAFDSINTVKPTAQKTFFTNVIPSLSNPLFTVDLRKGAPGTYDFGFVDDAKHTGVVTYVNADSSQGFWTFTSSGYSIGSGALSRSSIRGIADTGTTLLYLPDSIVNAYYRTVQGAKNDQQQGGYTYPCAAQLPSISFKIGSYTAVVPGNYITYAPVDSSGRTCFGGLQSSTGIGINIFGDIFLKSQFVVFQGGSSPRLGFAAKEL
ncbi:MAG: hypothetical protein Q9207_007524 [Kuettlingeria erythrocarpa]